MGTTSSVPGVIDALLGMGWQVPLFESWPGPEAKPEMIVLGGDTGETIEWTGYAIPTIKAGRKQRQEDYAVLFAIYVAGAPNTSPANPKPARDRAFQIFATVEDSLADDVTIDTDFNTVQWAVSAPRTAMPRMFENGWMYRIQGAFEVHARLV